MIDFKNVLVSKLITHRVTNNINTCTISSKDSEVTDKTENETIINIFCKIFTKNLFTNEFTHQINKDMNVLYKLSQGIFNNENFIDTSIDILKHLVSVSKHPNIKEGELVIIKYKNILFNNMNYEGVGIYKIEDRERFIVTDDNEIIDINFIEGISSGVINKAGLILNTGNDLTVLISNNKDAEYWSDFFFNIKSKQDSINLTNNYLKLTKNFIAKEMPNEYEIAKTDQIDLLNKSIEYFKKNEQFIEDDFVNNIFSNKEIIDSFNSYKHEYANKFDDSIENEFEIAPQIVKKQSRAFKSVLKLDKNFHIYIHGNRDLIEQGIDDRGRRFYKIYYEKEA